MSVVRVIVVSDAVCPWCWVGKRSIERGAAAAGVALELVWRPFQLDPTLPPEGKDKMLAYTLKFGPQARRMLLEKGPLHQRGEALGITFQYHEGSRVANTLNAHRIIAAAGAVSTPVQNAVVESLFKAYFTDGRDLGDAALLVQCAVEGGLSEDAAKAALQDAALEATVRGELADSSRRGIHGVPHFTFPDGTVISGGESPDRFAEVLRGCAKH